MDRHNQTHNDIKPQNFLVKFKNGQNDLTQIEIVLTDFGMAEADSKGGTPIFASPECFEKKEKRSDIFSFGRVILFLLLTKIQFVQWLFIPIKDKTRASSLQTICTAEKNIYLISQMMTLKNRMNLQSARDIFNDLRQKSMIKLSRVFVTAVENIINEEINSNDNVYMSELCDFRYRKISQFGYQQANIKFMFFSNMTFDHLSQATAESQRYYHRTQHTFNRIQNLLMSTEIHNNGKSKTMFKTVS